MKIYYRYDFNNIEPERPFLTEYIKVRDTPKGFVVIPKYMEDHYFCGRRKRDTKDNKEYKKSMERFVLNSSIKKYCYETKEEAFHSFMKRQESRFAILMSQINAVKECLDFFVEPENHEKAINPEEDIWIKLEAEKIRKLFKLNID